MMSQIVGNVFSELWWMLLILFGIGLLKAFKPYLKGKFGEFAVQAHVKLYLDERYILINDVTLPDEQGGTTQIDHIVLSPFGVFVIETKNYKGWILGNEQSEYWTQVIFKRKEKLYNPIRQNLGHISTLKKCLAAYPTIPYHSIIVFSSRATIKVTTTTDVVYTSQLLRTIKQYTEHNLTEQEKENIFEAIKAMNSIATYDKRKHVKSIQQRIEKRENAIRDHKCPQCGSDLI